MTKNFNTALRHYLHIFEANEHLVPPSDERSDMDVSSFTDALIDSMRVAGLFSKSESYIDFNKFKKINTSSEGETAELVWIGFKGEYNLKVRQVYDSFVVIVDCDDERLDSPKSSENTPWETYIDDVSDYIAKQEKEAEEEKNNETDKFKGEDAIELTSEQPSALPGAPAPGTTPPAA